MSQFMRNQRIAIQIWDLDITADDCGGEAVLDLTRPWFKRVFSRKRARPAYWEPFAEEWNQRQTDPRARLRSQAEMRELGLGKFGSLLDVAEDVFARETLLAQEVDEELEAAKFWLPLSRPLRETAKQRAADAQGRGASPKLLVSVQLVPQSDVEKLPAGFGRSAPNSNPTLPKPAGRLKFTWNPFVLCYNLLGPKVRGVAAGLPLSYRLPRVPPLLPWQALMGAAAPRAELVGTAPSFAALWAPVRARVLRRLLAHAMVFG